MASDDLEQFSKEEAKLPKESPLQQAHDTLYNYVKTAPCSLQPFFTRHKRGLVDLMIKINKGAVTELELLEAMQQIAKQTTSEAFSKIQQDIASIFLSTSSDETAIEKNREVNSLT